MELLVEFIGEIILEGAVELIKSKKVPLGIRIFLILLVSGLYLGLVVVFLYLGIKGLKDNIFISLIVIIMGLFILGLYVWFIYKLKKGTL
ncbi:MAG: hypothetical protein K2J20_03675 [Bacilli bacterium]|nr:hypothetical protein [Bacilli bacterium]